MGKKLINKDKSILVLIGNGKSTLTCFFLERKRITRKFKVLFEVFMLPRILKEYLDKEIKAGIRKGKKYIIHLQEENQYEKLSPYIQENSYKFILNF